MRKIKKVRSPAPDRVPVGELKARLSEYLSRVRAGQEVIVTDRGRPIARLAPLVGESAAEGRLGTLVRAGLARAPSKPLDPSWLRAERPKDPTGRSLEAVLEERGEGW